MTTPTAQDKVGESPAKEPVLTRTVATVVVALLASVLIKYGIDLDEATKTVLIGAVALLGPAVLGLLARLAAWSPDSVGKLIDDLTSRVASQERQRIENLNRAEASGSIPPTQTSSYDAPTTNISTETNKNDTPGGFL